MTVHYRVFENHALVVGHFRQSLTKAVFFEGIRRLSEHPDFRPGFDRLAILYDDLDLSALDADDMADIGNRILDTYFGGDPQHGPDEVLFRIAAVSSTAINKVIFNLYGAVLESGMPSPVPYRLFQDVDIALAWLGKPDIDPGELRIERMTGVID